MAIIQLPSPMTSVVAAIGLTLCYLIYWELTVGANRRRLIREYGCLPVNALPDWDPIFGLGTFRENTAAIKGKRALAMTRERFIRMGVDTWSFKFGMTKIIMTTEPENLKCMQATDFKNWSLPTRRKVAFRPLLGRGIFTTDGAEWQHSREMLRPNFHRSQVADLPVFESHVQDLIDRIPKDGSVVDLQELFFMLTMDSATEFLFGKSTRMLAPGTVAHSASKFADAFNRSQEDVANRSRFGRLGSLLLSDTSQKDIDFVHEFADGIVEEALARKHEFKPDETRRYVFLDELVQQMDDKVRIRSELINILLAGRDTTASLLSNVFHMLARRPDVLEKLRAEVDQLGQEKPTWTELKELKYLRAMLNETLRVWPVVPGNARQARKDTVLPRGGGPDGKSPMVVPAGTTVGWSVWSMHRRTDLYGPDADEFKPERWLGDKGIRPGWEYLPFNGGARICLGQQFALTEASYTTIRLLQEFKAFETTDSEPWIEWLTLTATHGNGLPLKMTPA